MKRKAIVFGASGKTGIQICRQLKEHDIPFSVFVRRGSENKLTGGQVEILTGDVLNQADVESAINQSFTDAIISLGSQSLRGTTIRSKGTENIINAFKSANSNATLHVISALGTGDSWSQLNWQGKLLTNILLKSVIRDHKLQEDLVSGSSLAYHIIRPVGLKDGEAAGSVHVQAEGYLPSQSIRRADLAKFVVESLLDNTQGFSSVCEKK